MSNLDHQKKKKWLIFSAVAMALSLIPRRSSKKADSQLSNNNNDDKGPDKKAANKLSNLK